MSRNYLLIIKNGLAFSQNKNDGITYSKTYQRGVLPMCNNKNKDYGPNPYVINVEDAAMKNTNFRTALWTGCHLQMTLMSIPVCSDIGLEVHEDTDQVIRVEEGMGCVNMGCNRNRLGYEQSLRMGDVVFVPAGTWHNIINTGNCPLKLSTVYAPPHHPAGTMHRTKEDAK